MSGLVGVIGCEDEDGVLKPRLLGSFLEETAQSHVGVAHTLVDGLGAFLGILLLKLLGHLKRMVTRGSEHGG